MTLPRNESARRLQVATSLLLFVSAITAAAVLNGCGPAQTEPDPAPTSQATLTPTSTPSPTPSPTSNPVIVPDGTYGPGLFTRGLDCPTPFFGSQYTANFIVSGNGTAISIAESQTRNSTATYNAQTRTVSGGGSGLVGSQQATWTVEAVLSTSGANQVANVTEIITLISNQCRVAYTSQSLTKR